MSGDYGSMIITFTLVRKKQAFFVMFLLFIYFNVNSSYINKISIICWGRRGRMVVGFLTTYAISAYHNKSCEFESRSGDVNSTQHYVIKFVSDLRQVCGFIHL
jgi:hypothetical protein